MKNYILWIDDSKDSKKAKELLSKKGVEFKVMNAPIGPWHTPLEGNELPLLIIPEGTCYGFNLIKSYINAAYPN